MREPLKERITIAGPGSALRGKQGLNILHPLSESEPSRLGSRRKLNLCPTPRRSRP